jgi:hypothetical protein
MLNLQQNACQSRKEAIQDPNVLDNEILQQPINPSPINNLLVDLKLGMSCKVEVSMD